jgi:hypothetical protein
MFSKSKVFLEEMYNSKEWLQMKLLQLAWRRSLTRNQVKISDKKQKVKVWNLSKKDSNRKDQVHLLIKIPKDNKNNLRIKI